MPVHRALGVWIWTALLSPFNPRHVVVHPGILERFLPAGHSRLGPLRYRGLVIGFKPPSQAWKSSSGTKMEWSAFPQKRYPNHFTAPELRTKRHRLSFDRRHARLSPRRTGSDRPKGVFGIGSRPDLLCASATAWRCRDG